MLRTMMPSFCTVFDWWFAYGCSLAMAAEEVNIHIQAMLATFPNIDQLKSEQEECLRQFIAEENVVVLLQ